MQISPQDSIIAALDEKITRLRSVLEETIVKHSDAEYDLKDLKLSLEKLSGDKFEDSREKMLVMANEWKDVD